MNGVSNLIVMIDFFYEKQEKQTLQKFMFYDGSSVWIFFFKISTLVLLGTPLVKVSPFACIAMYFSVVDLSKNRKVVRVSRKKRVP